MSKNETTPTKPTPKPNWTTTWLPVIFWMGVIFTFSAMPSIPTSQIIWWDFVIKKLAHITEYAILFTLVFRAVNLTYGFKQTNRKIALIILICCILYALSDEFHQSFTPGRTSTIRDVGFDTAGMLIAFLIIKRPRHPFIKKNIFAN